MNYFYNYYALRVLTVYFYLYINKIKTFFSINLFNCLRFYIFFLIFLDVICGLFGYVEFLNWHNLVTVSNWPQENECLCLFFNGESKIDCNCNNHINSLVLVYYINGFLMLN